MNMNTGLRVVVAALLGTTMQMTFASSPTDPIKIASEIGTPAGEIKVTGGFTFDIPVMKGKLIKTKTATSDEPYFVNITLSGGAVFGALPTSLTCAYSADGAGATPATVDSPPVTVRGNVATYRLAPGNSAGAVVGLLTGATCTLTMPADSIILTSGVKDYGITVTAAWFDAYEKVSASVVGTLISFAQGAQASVEQGQVTVDVSSPSLSRNFMALTNHVSATFVAGGTIVARLGNIKYAQTVGVNTLAKVQVDTDDYLKSFTLTVSGAPLNAVQQTATTSAHSTAGIFLSTDGCLTSAATPLNSPRNPTSGKITFAGVVPGAGAASVTWSVCMVANNVNAIERGQVGFTVGSIVGQAASDVPNLGVVDPTLTQVTKNGTSLKVLNIPSPDSPFDLPTIRLYNMGTTTGRVTGTLYSQGDTNNVGGGEVLGAANTVLVESLAPKAVKAIPSAEIGKLFGKTTWTGRAWLQIESEIKGLRVQALIRTNVGGQQVLTNMSDRVMLDGEKLERTE